WAWNLSSSSWRRASGSSLSSTGSNLRAVLTSLVISTLCTSLALAVAASCAGVRSVSLAHCASDAATVSVRTVLSVSATNCLASAIIAASPLCAGCFSTFSGGGSGAGWGLDLLPHAAARIRRTSRAVLRTAALYPSEPTPRPVRGRFAAGSRSSGLRRRAVGRIAPGRLGVGGRREAVVLEQLSRGGLLRRGEDRARPSPATIGRHPA